MDLLVGSDDDGPLTVALEALEGPVAPKTSPYVTAQARRLAAHLVARAGERDAAAEHWRAAQKIMSEAGVVFDAAVLALELAEAGSEAHAGDDSLRAEAIATFERLRARPWVERGCCRAARPIH